MNNGAVISRAIRAGGYVIKWSALAQGLQEERPQISGKNGKTFLPFRRCFHAKQMRGTDASRWGGTGGESFFLRAMTRIKKKSKRGVKRPLIPHWGGGGSRM